MQTFTRSREQVSVDPIGGRQQRIEMRALVVVRSVHTGADQRHRHITAGLPEGFAVRAIERIGIHFIGDAMLLGQLAQALAEAVMVRAARSL